MSKGLGRMERAVLGELGDGGRQCTTYGLASCIFGITRPYRNCMDKPPVDATEAQMVSLRRAIRSLQRKGLVKVSVFDYPGKRRNLVTRA